MIDLMQKVKLEKILKRISSPEEFDEYLLQSLNKSIVETDHKLNKTGESVRSVYGNLNEFKRQLALKFSEIEKSVESKIGDSSLKSFDLVRQTRISLEDAIQKETKATEKIIRNHFDGQIKLNKEETELIIKKIQKDIEDLFWSRSLNGSNNVQAVLNIKSGGVTVSNNVIGINFVGSTVTSNPDATITVTASSSGATLITPISGALNQATFVWSSAPKIIFRDGVPMQQTSTDGTPNWTGTTTTVLSIWPTSDIFALS